MLLRFQTLFSLVFPACHLLAGAASFGDQHVLSSESKTTFRDYTESDLDDLTDIIVDAFAPGDGFRYIHQDHAQHKDYYWHCTREKWRQDLENGKPGNVFLKVLAVPQEASETGSLRSEKVVSFSYWKIGEGRSDHSISTFGSNLLDFPVPQSHEYRELDKGDGPPYDCSLHLATNMTRSNYVDRFFKQTITKIEKLFPKRFELHGLATHPDWDGHGFAAKSLRWGFGQAEAWGLPIVLIGTPAGYPLYRSMGFKDVFNMTIPMMDGKGSFWYELMARENQ